MIKIQKKDFNTNTEIQKIKDELPEAGAVSTFIGYVRNNNNNKKVSAIELEVYEKMAKKTLKNIELDACNKWDLYKILIIHRYGKIKVNEKIVLIAAFSKHRKDGFNAITYIMDFLKKDAPFWKKEFYNDDFEWLEN